VNAPPGALWGALTVGAWSAGGLLAVLLLLRFQPLFRAIPQLGRLADIVIPTGYAIVFGLSAFRTLQHLPPQLRSDAARMALKTGFAVLGATAAAQRILELRRPALDASGGATRP
jgi:hypothetical protein